MFLSSPLFRRCPKKIENDSYLLRNLDFLKIGAFFGLVYFQIIIQKIICLIQGYLHRIRQLSVIKGFLKGVPKKIENYPYFDFDFLEICNSGLFSSKIILKLNICLTPSFSTQTRATLYYPSVFKKYFQLQIYQKHFDRFQVLWKTEKSIKLFFTNYRTQKRRFLQKKFAMILYI